MAALVKRFTGNTSEMSLRPAAKLIGVTAPTITALRKWVDAGADPDTLSLEQSTIDGLRAWALVADQITARRAGLRIAADRLEDVVRELREEASKPDAGALATSSGAGAGERVVSRAKPRRTPKGKKPRQGQGGA